MQTLRPHLSYANVVATLALLLVLAGGGAYAASKIGTQQIKAGAVTAPKLANEAVKAAKLRRVRWKRRTSLGRPMAWRSLGST